MLIWMPAVDSVSCSVSVSVDWSALELAGLFLCLPVNWTEDMFVCLPVLHFPGWSAFVPEGYSVSCYAWLALWRQLGPWVDPAESACDWGSGFGSGQAGWVQKN